VGKNKMQGGKEKRELRSKKQTKRGFSPIAGIERIDLWRIRGKMHNGA